MPPRRTPTTTDPSPPSAAETTARIVAMVCLTVVVVSSIAALTIVAVTTTRDLRIAEALTGFAALWIGLLGGLTIWDARRRHRWRIEREDVNGSTESDRLDQR